MTTPQARFLKSHAWLKIRAWRECKHSLPIVMDNVTSRLPYKVNILRDMDIGSAECKDIMYTDPS